MRTHLNLLNNHFLGCTIISAGYIIIRSLPTYCTAGINVHIAQQNGKYSGPIQYIGCGSWLHSVFLNDYFMLTWMMMVHFTMFSKPVWNIFYTALIIPVELTILIYSVFTQEGEFSFSLESVKKLWDILANGEIAKKTSLLSVFSAVTVCANPLLPEEFQPLCQSNNAQAHISRLGKQCRIE